MPTPPDFTAGAVLTAAQMNAVGLWRITGCTVTSVGGTAATASNGVITIGTGNTSITVANAFPSDFEMFRIVIDNYDTNNTASHDIQLTGITTANYFHNGFYQSWGGAAMTAYGPAALTSFICSANVLNGTNTQITMEINNPNKPRRKHGTVFSEAGNGSFFSHLLNNTTTVSTGFTLSKSGNTMTGGTIRVYGYRN